MKKNLSLILVASFALVGCGAASTTAQPSLNLANRGWRNYYVKGEEVDLRGLIANYYSSPDASAQSVNVTSNMISGFSTESTGEKQMTVSYQGLSKTISYTVYDFESSKYELPNDLIGGINKIWHYDSSTKTIKYSEYSSYKQIRDSFDNPTKKIEGTYTHSVNKDGYACFRFKADNNDYEYAVDGEYIKVYSYAYENNVKTSESTSQIGVGAKYDAANVKLPQKSVIYTSEKTDQDWGDQKKAKHMAFVVDENYDVKVYAEIEMITDVTSLTPVLTFTFDMSYLSNGNSVGYKSESGSVTVRTSEGSATYTVTWNDRLSISGLSPIA